MKFKILIIFIFILIGISSKSFSQCPTNLQFELGNFTNWQLDSGKTCSMTGSLFPPFVNLQWNTQPHHLISDITPKSYNNFSGLDSLGGFPLVCPFSNDPFSVRISSYPIYYKHTNIPNNITNSISYRLHVPLNSSSYSLTYYYAIIFQDPLHLPFNQPRFQVEIYDSLSGEIDSCASFEIVSTSSLPGFFTAPFLNYNGVVIVKPWAGALIHLKNKGGKTIILKFTVVPCGGLSPCISQFTNGPHFSIAYLDFSPFCNSSPITNGYCAGASKVPLYAPPGFQTYTWYDSALTTIISTNDTLNILVSNVSSACLKVKLIITPYYGYGCADTLPYQICLVPKPQANFAFIDSYCVAAPCVFWDSSKTFSLGTYINNWQWNFGDPSSGLADTSTLKTPIHYFNAAGNYVVSLVVKSNVSCISDTLFKTIHITKPNTAMALNVFPDSACAKTPVTLSWSGTPQANFNYTWQINPGILQTGQLTNSNTIQVSWDSVGTYLFNLVELPLNPQLTACGTKNIDSVFIKGKIPQFVVSGIDTICAAPTVLTASTNNNNALCKGGISSCVLPLTAITDVSPSANLPSPFMGDYLKSKNRLLFTPSELNAIGINGPGAISSIAFKVIQKNSTNPYLNYTIKMACTTDTMFVINSHLPLVAATTVYANTYSTQLGWNVFALSTPYIWDGISSLYIETCFNDTAITGRDYVDFDITSTFLRYQRAYRQQDSLLACDSYFPTSGFFGMGNRPALKFTFCPNQIAATTTYQWSTVPPSSFTAISPSITVQPIQTTTYQCTLNDGGCSNSLLKTITVLRHETIQLQQSICSGTSIVFNNQTISTSGVYKDTLVNSVNCDSIIMLTLTIKPISTTAIAQSICMGQSILFNGINQSSAGIYKDTLIGSQGCDSIITLTLTIKPISTTAIAQSICMGQSVLFNGINQNSAGIYKDTLLNYQGCDSIIILTLTIKPISTTAIAQSICGGQSVLFNGINQSSAGIYKDTLMNYEGCDSIITLNLQVNNASSFQNNIVICSDQQYVLANGQVVSAAGNYIDTIANYVNCDSVITTHLEVIQKPLVYLGNDTAICALKSIELVAPNYINAQYIWNDLSNQTTVSASNAGLYSVSIVVPPCNAVTDTIQISHIDCSCLLEMPNVFTPNGDGLNDQIKPVIFCDAPIDHYEWMIYNRWGELVFKSTNIAESWNGIYKNQTQNEQTFVYIIRYTNPITFNEIKLKGDFILLR